jgi:predicted extracellular nuclease
MRVAALGVVAGCVIFAAMPASAALMITEWMYNPLGATNGEYVEIANRGPTAVDLTGWSFDDSTRTPGSLSLSSLGTLAVGEAAIITDLTDAAFRTEWGLSATAKVLGGSTQNLSRGDEINIYDGSSVLVDRLTYDDQGLGNVKGPRTQGISGNPSSPAALGANNASLWVLSAAGDAYQSRLSLSGDIGSPGAFILVPEPGALAAMSLLTLVGVGRTRRARQSHRR